MSMWTHIIASIEVNTNTPSDVIVEYVIGLLEDAPKITGRDEDANIFVNTRHGHNVSIHGDCLRCPYGSIRVLYDDGFECKAPDKYECPTGQYQTCVIITVTGNLRDRSKHQTKREWEKFYKFIKKQDGWQVRQVACSISGAI